MTSGNSGSVCDLRRGLLQVSPGLFVDPMIRCEVQPGKLNWLLLNARGYAAIGLEPRQYLTLRRLWEAQFIILSPVAPRLVMLNLDSWEKHRAAVAEDPWFWARGGENLRRYQAACEHFKFKEDT